MSIPAKKPATKDKTVGAWHPSAPVVRDEAPKAKWRFNSDPDVMENVMPINGARIPASDTPDGEKQ